MARRNTIEIVIKGEDRASAVLKKIGGATRTLGKVAMIGLGGLAVAGAGAGAAMTKLAIDAAPLAGIEKAFEGIAEASGESADEMLRALEKGSAGMIAQSDLMKSYNLAAQLVGDQFANQLPEAMGYLGKVAAATGEDMGYMMDSLVRGVGRLSPMILDNLGIQVDLNAAYEAYAESVGKSVSELTKQEQQTALMNQVMEKLAENTANMPDVAGSAAASVAALQAKFKNLKEAIGKALLPVLEIALGWFTKAADVIIPKIIGAVETLSFILESFLSGAPGDFPWEDIFPEWLADFMYKLSDVFEGFVALFQGLQKGIVGVDFPWEDIFPPWLADVAYTLTDIYKTIAPLVSKIMDLITSFVSWKDVLLALGVAIAAVIIPILASLVSAVAPVLAVAAALVAAIALVRNVWEKDLLGIRTAIETVVPIIADVWSVTWEKAKAAWDSFWGALKPSLEKMYARLQEFWAEIQPKLHEAWMSLQVLWDQIVALWNENVVPALKKLGDALGLGGMETGKFSEILGKLVGFLLEAELEGLIVAITGAINAFVFALQMAIGIVDAFKIGLDTIKDGFDALGDVSLPDWLTPGSATPFEEAIRGITNAMGAFLSGAPGDFPWEDIFPPDLADSMYELSHIFEGFIALFQDIQRGVFGVDYPWEDIFPDWLADFMYELSAAIQTVIEIIDPFRAGLDTIRDGFGALSDVSLPEWLVPGSATPFEEGIRGITDAMSGLNAATEGLGLTPPAGAAFGGGGVAGGGHGDEAVLYKMLAALQELVKLGQEHGVVVVETNNAQRAREQLSLNDERWALMPGV